MAFKRSSAPKDHAIARIRVTADEKAKVVLKANHCGMSIAEYVLSAALGRQTRAKHVDDVINELRLINATIREIYHKADKPKPEELGAVLEAVVRAIDRVGNLKTEL